MLIKAAYPTQAHAAPPAGPEDARGGLAVYCPDVCGPADLGDLALRRRLPAIANRPSATVERWGPEFGVPDATVLADWGQGDVDGVADAQQVLVIRWAGPVEGARDRLLAVAEVALAAGKWIEDLDTGRIYDRAAFTAALSAYRGDTPDVTALVAAQPSADQGEGTLRLVTHGLRKVGLAEIVVTASADEDVDGQGQIALATGQAIFEQGLSGSVEVDSEAFTSRAARQSACGVRGVSELSYARRVADDPHPPLVGVVFTGDVADCGGAAAPEADARPPRTAEGRPLAVQVGAEPEASEDAPDAPATDDGNHDVKGPQSLDVVQARALERLRGPVRHAFQQGLTEGESLLVKIPLQADDGRVEWLWVTVDGWGADNVLRGVMANEPRLVKTVNRGDPVEAHVDYVFDYLWVKADGTREGNTTQAFVE